MSLSENTSKIEQLLAAISALPEAGGGGLPSGGRLPTGYTELSYLESDGNQHIDTGWAAQTGDTITIVASLSSGTGECAFGGYQDEWELYFKGNYSTSMVPSVWSNKTKIASTQITPSSAAPYNQKVTFTVKFGSNQTAGTARLFRYRLDYYPFSGRIYSAVVENASGEKVREFVPCINPSDEYGMYDLANDVFYGNLGSGSFTGGSSDMPTVEQATPEISVSSSGLITATVTQSAGYVEAGTKSATKQLTTKAAATYTPTTSNQTIESGQYLTGTQTIMGDADLVAGNIKKGVSIFNVTGTYEGSGGNTADPVLQSKTVTPSETAQTVTPDSGYDGLSSVSVGAISKTYIGSSVTKKSAQTYTPGTSNQTIAAGQYLNGAQTIKGDVNLIAENIKKGVSIFNVMGIFEGSSGGGLPAGVSALACGERIVSTDTTGKVDVEHNLGVVPNFVVWMAESDTSSPVANMQVAGAIFGKKVEFTTNYINPLCYAVSGYNGSGSSNGTVSSANNNTYLTTTTCAILGNSTYKLKSGVKYRWVCGVLDNIA